MDFQRNQEKLNQQIERGKTTVEVVRQVMPVEGFEPSSPCGHLFLRQTRIPFRHTGSHEAWDTPSQG